MRAKILKDDRFSYVKLKFLKHWTDIWLLDIFAEVVHVAYSSGNYFEVLCVR